MADLTGPVGLAAIAIAMRAIVNTYGGWEDVVHFGEEMHKPERTLPRSMMIGIVSVAVVYLLVNLALLHVLALAEIARSNLPAADAARVALGSFGDSAFTVFGIVSVAGDHQSEDNEIREDFVCLSEKWATPGSTQSRRVDGDPARCADCEHAAWSSICGDGNLRDGCC
jgi:amino acid transporter